MSARGGGAPAATRPGAKRLRVTVNVAGKSDTTSMPKVVLVPDSLQQLLDEATQKLGMTQAARKAWTRDGTPIESISQIRESQLVLVSTATRFPGRRPEPSPAKRRAGALAGEAPSSRRVAMDGALGATPEEAPAALGGGGGAAAAARLQQASARHAELVDSIRVGERLVRELRQQVEKLRNRSAEERQKVDGLRGQAEELSASVAQKQSELASLAQRAAVAVAATPPQIAAPTIQTDDEIQDAGPDAAALEASLAIQAAQLEASERALAEAQGDVDLQADRAVRLEEELQHRQELLAASATELEAKQRSLDELETRFMVEVESRAVTEAQLRAELAAAQADAERQDEVWSADIQKVRDECQSECEAAAANATASAEIARQATSEQGADVAKLGEQMLAMQAAHEAELAALRLLHAEEVARAREAWEAEKHQQDAELRATLEQLREQAEADKQNSASALADAENQATHLALDAAQREQGENSEIAKAVRERDEAAVENEILQTQLASQSAAAASAATEIAALKQQVVEAAEMAALTQTELEGARRAAAQAADAEPFADPAKAGARAALTARSPRGHADSVVLVEDEDADEPFGSSLGDVREQLKARTPREDGKGHADSVVLVDETSLSAGGGGAAGAEPALVDHATKSRAQQGGKKPPTRGRRGGRGTQATPPVGDAPPAIGAPVNEAAAIAQAVKDKQAAAAEAARQRRQQKSKPSAGQAAVAAVAAPAVAAPAPVPAAAAAGSHTDEMSGNPMFLKMQARQREAEEKEERERAAEAERQRLKAEWEEIDSEQGIYYHHKPTGETSWDVPECWDE